MDACSRRLRASEGGRKTGSTYRKVIHHGYQANNRFYRFIFLSKVFLESRVGYRNKSRENVKSRKLMEVTKNMVFLEWKLYI